MAVLKFKITGKRLELKNVGIDEILDRPRGSLWRVTRDSGGNEECLGDIFMRTDEKDWPLVLVSSKDTDYQGMLWSVATARPYTFEEVEGIFYTE